MKWIINGAVLAVLSLSNSATSAEMSLAGHVTEGNWDASHGAKNEDGCGFLGCGRLAFDLELTFLRYLQEGGVTDVAGQPAEFDMELAPRFELSYVGVDGLGVRASYWYFDHDATSLDGDYVDVDTYYADLELFQEYQLACHTCLEASIGVRYLDFTQITSNLAASSTMVGACQGFGGTAALEAKRATFGGAIYARGRFSVLTGDADITNIIQSNEFRFSASGNTITQTELALGYERSRSLGDWGILTLRAGAEWQNWTNVAMADTSFGGIGNDDVLEDAGFAGLVFRVGLSR